MSEDSALELSPDAQPESVPPLDPPGASEVLARVTKTNSENTPSQKAPKLSDFERGFHKALESSIQERGGKIDPPLLYPPEVRMQKLRELEGEIAILEKAGVRSDLLKLKKGERAGLRWTLGFTEL